ncbi:hypothetical protein J4772_04655 [Cohnella sp. LGH]|uniref:hypothetical protein n=1 Tax=Cohnella sp. LGH TaxID=1619153 RepID=UPI001ADAAC86|nr:hypothetical protein [Cohnella sp. LGH]QTH43720.1 hypothetical protein J4772_04655 [Cohnella sp. LGH]
MDSSPEQVGGDRWRGYGTIINPAPDFSIDHAAKLPDGGTWVLDGGVNNDVHSIPGHGLKNRRSFGQMDKPYRSSFHRLNYLSIRGGVRLINRKKPVPKRVGTKAVNPFLQLFSGTNFTGTVRRFRGSLGIRNLSSVGLNNTIESLRFTTGAGLTGTVVLFEGTGYSGDFVKFNPTANIPDLSTLNFDNQASSLVVSSLALSDAEIAAIQDSGTDLAEVLRKIRAARKRRAAKRMGKK